MHVLLALALVALLPAATAAAPAAASTSPAVQPAAARGVAPAPALAAPAAPSISWWDIGCNAVLTPTISAVTANPVAGVAGSVAACEGLKLLGADKLAADAAKKLGDSIIGPMAEGAKSFAAQVITSSLVWWLQSPSISIEKSGVTTPQDPMAQSCYYLSETIPAACLSKHWFPPKDVGTVPVSLQGLCLGVGSLVAVLLTMFAGIRTIVQRKGTPMAQAIQGLVIHLVVCITGIAIIDSLLIASDKLTFAIIDTMFQGNANLVMQMERMLFPTGINVLALLLVSVIALLVGLVQLITVFLRQAAIPIYALLLPVASSGQIGGDRTRQWLPRLYTSVFTVIAYKPMAALIMAAGFTEMANGNAWVDWVRGLTTLVLSVVALKAMMGLFSPLGMQMAGATGGLANAIGNLGGAAALGSALGSGKGDSDGGGGGKGGDNGGSFNPVSHASAMDQHGPASEQNSSMLRQAASNATGQDESGGRVPQQGGDQSGDATESATNSTTGTGGGSGDGTGGTEGTDSGAPSGDDVGGPSGGLPSPESSSLNRAAGITLVAAEVGRQGSDAAGSAFADNGGNT
ncbi:hypothetical protein OG948_33275 [Embleya sp. NBC_00888]|uniref:hypothetical protein n=1 Tax=Embleya sp. NBC_00888 TaxID=2975960 RepID=UPI00386E562E|nr:hypothetical protein OG948_33275 [Embleya sp. NBC_00888]